MHLRFYRLRFHFLAQAPIRFAPGMAANTLRGAFGCIFRQIACVPHCVEAKTCDLRDSCAYARIFEPIAAGAGPSGLADPPRPFVFRAAHLDGRTLPTGSPFHFDVHLFLLRDTAIAYFVLAFAQLVRQGLGPGRAQAALTRVDQLDPAGEAIERIFDGATLHAAARAEPSSLPLEMPRDPVHSLQVRFVTPMELKSGHQLAERPEFGILLARIRDRLSTLGALYGSGPLEMDFAAFGLRASAVAMTRCELTHETVTRFSTRTRQSHPLGGFTGIAEYAGDLTEFVPFLIAAQFAGVGRQTTWGKGEIAI